MERMKCIMFGEKILDYWDDIMKDLGDIIAIPRASQADHAIANAKAAEIFLDDDDLAILNQAFPAPDHAVPLDVV